MSNYEVRFNVYNSSKVGHANVSFYKNGEHVFTVGANIRLNTPQLAIPEVTGFELDDGIYRDETAYQAQAVQTGAIVSGGVPVSSSQYESLLASARALEGQTFNYSLFTEACTDLVEDFYTATGHPGEFGDLFAADIRTGSLVWERVPVSELATVWPDHLAYYTPNSPVVSDIDPSDAIAPVSDPQWAGVESTAERAQAAADARVDEFSAEYGLESSEHIDLEWELDVVGGLGFGIADPVEQMPIARVADDLEFRLSGEMSTAERADALALQEIEAPDTTITVSVDPWDEPEFHFGSSDNDRANRASDDRDGVRGHGGESEGQSGSGMGSFGADPMSQGVDLAASVSSEGPSFGEAYEGGLGDYESFGPATDLSFDIDREPAGAQEDLGMTDDPWDF